MWIQYIHQHLDRLVAHARSFPALEDLRIAGFADPSSTAVVLSLRFQSTALGRTRLREWADRAGIQLIETAGWSREQRAEFTAAIGRFRCASNGVYNEVLELCIQLSRANAASLWRRRRQTPLAELSDGVPDSIVVSESVRHEVDVHEFYAHRRYPRAQTTEL